MEQRRLRLGDILDDYCPRERRVTNHAVVAMIEDKVKQTRCTTCDAEHPYKGGLAPKRRKKETTPAVGSSPAHSPIAVPVPVDAPVEGLEEEFHDEEPLPVEAADIDAAAAADRDNDNDDIDTEVDDEPDDPVRDLEDGPVHRPLIRATLPRPEGQKDVRTPPDFTIRQAGGRGNVSGPQFRGGGGSGGGGGNPRMRRGSGGQGNGHRPPGASGGRFAGARPGPGGQGRGQGGGNFRPAQPRQGGGGRKRSR